MAWTILRNGTYYIGWREGPKDRYASAKTKDPAAAERARLKKELELTVAGGPLAEPQPLMLFDALTELYKKEADISARTLRINHYSWKKFISIVGNKPIGEITLATIKDFKDTLVKQHAAAASISLYLRDLNKVLGFAAEKQLVRWNACKKPGTRRWAVEHPEEELTWRFLTKEEEVKLLSVCNPLLARMVSVALETGLRISQVIEMDWKRYDHKARLYVVPKQKRQKVRHIPIFERAFSAMGPLRFGGRVFPGTNNDQIEKMFARAVKNSRIGGACTFHDLRHTFVSRVCAYLSPVEVRDLMGWSSVALVDRYTHTRTVDIQEKMARAHSSMAVVLSQAG